MPFAYDAPPPIGSALRQGEVLGDVWIHRPLLPATRVGVGQSIDVDPTLHPFVVVLHPDCDLEQDFAARQSTAAENDTRLVPQVLLCDAFTEAELRPRVAGSDLFRRIKQNQDERYHRFKAAPISSSQESVPDLFLDFRRSLAVHTSALYLGLEPGAIRRCALIPAVYVHDLVHRFYGYLSRVALPN